ncbi:dienelactone hydrolase family protein [Flavihumibacter solisilvae]|uniref:Carboxymethylenebutenolidase n=1 Tax=Flavihumibacter solisilvae TaxID=1349421 RepID=A0A0C1L3H1_9BACT|nr:dienelactone hydrolase family protein [Flavihumibacter solisilvae]KIC94512.1 carboxymethylenebutenolidase [Flavihumibacter solisilvae]
MKFKLTILIAAIFFSRLTFGQFYPKYEEYKHYSIHKKNDTINYHVYSAKDLKDTDGIILFIQGSGAQPLFKIIKEDGSETIQSQVPFNPDKIPGNFAFVVVSKKCLPFSTDVEMFKTPECYYENEGLDYRVWQYNEVINQIVKKQIQNPKKLIVIGHSEGTDVVAKLGTLNKKITHIGFWAGGGQTQYYDFALFIRKKLSEGKIDEKTAAQKMDSLFAQIKQIEADPNSTSKSWLDNTYRRWSQFSEPAVENLLKIDVPIFVAFGAKDISVPVESALIIPIEFSRHNKNNLTFRLYPDYDHSFNKVPTNETERWESHWMDVFEEFMGWANNPETNL